MKKRVQKLPEVEKLEKSTDLIKDAIKEISPYKVELSAEEKSGNRSMAEGREGYVRLVSSIANQHPESLGRSDNPKDLQVLLDLLQPARANRIANLKSLEIAEELELALSLDIMTYVDRYVKTLQVSREHDGTLDLAMREVDEWNKRFGRDQKHDTPEEPES